MQDQYSRTQLLLGAEAMTKLHDSRVAVFGVGGVGGYTVEALARSGVGALDLIDDDKVCLTNLNRQIIATHKTVGRFKVDVAEERVHDIDPNIKVTTYKTFFGRGAIVIGLAAVIIGEAVFGRIFHNFALKMVSVSLGAIIYYIVIQLVLTLGFDANLLKLLSASVVAVFLAVPYWKGRYFAKPAAKKANKEGANNA